MATYTKKPKNKDIKKLQSRENHILFYGDYNCTTGFGNVSKELIYEAFVSEKIALSQMYMTAL